MQAYSEKYAEMLLHIRIHMQIGCQNNLFKMQARYSRIYSSLSIASSPALFKLA